MYYGGRPFSTIFKLARMMKLKAIYPPDALRINRLVNGRVCEFCFNVRVDEKDNRNSLISDFGCPNSRPVEMRGRYPVFACITCLTRLRNRSISKDWAYPCLTRRWEKAVLKQTGEGLITFTKLQYLQNRRLYLDILDDNRVLAYPGGTEFTAAMDSDESEEEEDASTLRENDHRYEILWADVTKEHGTGTVIGPLINMTSFKQLVNFSKNNPSNSTSDNIQAFLATQIYHPPTQDMYDNFLDIFDEHKERAVCHYVNRRKELRRKQYLSRLRKIENTIETVCKVVHFMNIDIVKQAYATNRINWNEFSIGSLTMDVAILRRTLLCYREEHDMKMNYGLTYDTGWWRLDQRLHCILKRVLQAPTKVQKCDRSVKSMALAVAKMFIEVFAPPHTYDNIPAIMKNGLVKTKFGKIYRCKYFWRHTQWTNWERKKWTQYGLHSHSVYNHRDL